MASSRASSLIRVSIVCLFPTLILGVSTTVSKYWLRALHKTFGVGVFKYYLLTTLFLDRLSVFTVNFSLLSL